MRTRSLLPPILTRGIIRSVWLLKAAPSAGAGAAVQVPTQYGLSLMAFDPFCSRVIATTAPRSRLHRQGLFGRMRRSLQVVGVHVVRQHRVAGDQIRQGHGSALPESGSGGIECRPDELAVLVTIAGEVIYGYVHHVRVSDSDYLTRP